MHVGLRPVTELGTYTLRLNFPNVLAVILAVVFVIVLSLVSRRLIGIKVSRLRSFLTALIGTLVGLVGANEIVHGKGDAPTIYALTAVFGVLATMVLLILPEALARTRASDARRRKRIWTHPLRAIRRVFAPISRSLEVLRAARRRGLVRAQYLSPEAVTTAEFGLRLRLTIEDVGGMFVKFGQIASTRSDLLSPAVIEELSHLRAAVRPIPANEVRPLIERELGRPIEDAFTSFDLTPLASASIGQAHRAVLLTGEEVVVKIQRPDLDDLLARDATVLRLAADIAERRVPAARDLGVRQLADELILSMGRELDYLPRRGDGRPAAYRHEPRGSVG